ncbi:MAG: response regulator [Elusimicrobiota bacterium]
MYRIVAVEDDPIVRRLFSRTLTSESYECIMAVNAASGLQTCLEQKPDLILLDVHLPDGNGIEVCRQFKDDMRLRHIPILIITGDAVSVEERMEGLESGADDYILKPFNPKELLARIKGILKASTRPTQA